MADTCGRNRICVALCCDKGRHAVWDDDEREVVGWEPCRVCKGTGRGCIGRTSLNLICDECKKPLNVEAVK